MKVHIFLNLKMWVLPKRTISIGSYQACNVRHLAPESVSILRAAKTIVLQGCDVVNTSKHTCLRNNTAYSRVASLSQAFEPAF